MHHWLVEEMMGAGECLDPEEADEEVGGAEED